MKTKAISISTPAVNSFFVLKFHAKRIEVPDVIQIADIEQGIAIMISELHEHYSGSHSEPTDTTPNLHI